MERTDYIKLIEELAQTHNLSDEAFLTLLTMLENSEVDEEAEQYLYQQAERVRQEIYGTDIFVRGLIEFTNYCKNDCYYCGIRRSNKQAQRYRLTKEQILACCEAGYQLGLRTFVLQGGEDAYFTQERVCEIIKAIKELYPECAVTLSIGEKKKEEYQAYFSAGADRYLLRHETADLQHYRVLHPQELSGTYRQQCLRDLKEIGFQVGCGMMAGAPGQKLEHLLADFRFMQSLQPHMVGIGPFIPHKDTPFKEELPGTLRTTLHLLAIVRLMFPDVLLPATTALGTIHPQGREMGLKAGANVVMPNLSPSDVRGKYLLYDGKLCTGDEAAENLKRMAASFEKVGYHMVSSRGDHCTVTERE